MRRRAILVGLSTVSLLAACTNDPGVRATEGNAIEGSTPDTVTPDSGPDDTTGTTLPYADAIDWGGCTDEVADDPVLECATLAVPLDYDDPDSETIDIALVRVPATGDRKGAVLFNPGGPGGSGFDPIAMSGTVIQSELGLDDFDIVGFDPRGVDRSNGIRCVDDAFMDEHLYLDDTPDTPEEEALLDEADTGFNDGCIANYGDTLQYYSTANTARDMDMIRAGLGDEQISYLGISYGTYLGGVYATLFPDRVRAMVLDSAYEPNGDTVEEQYLTQIVGFENAFNEWVAWCEEDIECTFHADDVGARWETLRQSLDDNPVPAADGREGNQSVLDVATSAALYSQAEWPVLADALAKAEAGDPSGLFSLADSYKGRHDDGTFDTLFQSIGIIQCASGIEDQVPPDPEALLKELQEKAPRFSKNITLEDLQDAGNSCDELMPDQPVVELDYAGDAPILVVGGTNDPATPIRWAEEMVGELGPSARLLTFTGEGHGQLLVSTCVTDAEAATLADLELPDEGASCDPDPVVERPDWWDGLPVPPGVGAVESLPAVKAALGLTETLGYGEVRTTSMSSQDAADSYEKALSDAGFTSLGSQDLGIDDVVEYGFFTPDGDLLIVIALGPASFETEDLGMLQGVVPADATVVVLAYIPN